MPCISSNITLRIALLSALAIFHAAAQDEPITRVTVKQVRIDVTVTDYDGKAVTDLQSEDFRVFQDGRRQSPIHAQYVAGPSSSLPLYATGNRELSAGAVERTLLIVLDDADMPFEDFVYSRRAIQSYLDQAMKPGDLVAILRTRRSSSFLDQFTADRNTLRRRLDGMVYQPPMPLESPYHPLMATLGPALRAMKTMPGRKSLILFCERMLNQPYMMPSYQRLADSALRSAVRIYGINPRGLVVAMPEISTRGRAGSDLSAAAAAAKPMVPPPVTEEGSGIAFLAHETGGLFFENNNDLGAELRAAVNDEAGYYLLAWDPGDKAFSPSKGSFADYHKIKVEVLRHGLMARTFRGFYGVDGGSVMDQNRPPKIAMQQALLSPFHSSQLDVEMDSQFDLKDGHPYIRSFVYVDGKDVQFTPHPDGGRTDCYSFALEFLTLPEPEEANIDTLAESQITSMEVCGPSYEALAHNGLAVTMLHPVSKKGNYRMQLAVRNVTGDVSQATASLVHAPLGLMTRDQLDPPVGSAHQLVEVPDWRSNAAFFGLRVESDKRAPSSPQAKSPTETAKNETLAYRPALEGDPSVRRFQAGDTLRYQAHVVNVTDPAAEIRILRPDGAEVYAGKADSAEGDVKGSFPIDASLVPGSYDLHLIVTGKTTKGKPYHGAKDIEFTVQK